jgi:hypothetical protein
LKLLRLETWPPDAPKVLIFAIFKADLQTYIYFHLPWPAKFAVGFPRPGEWSPFGNNLPVTRNAPSFDRTFLGFPSTKLYGFFTKTKEVG